MDIINADNPEEKVTFSAPIVMLSENKGTNAVQAFGATMTYYRRYLYMLALDICEADTFDAGVAPNPTSAPTPKVAPAPSLTDAEGNASDLQIKQMKELLKKLREIAPSTEGWIAQVAVDTKGFKVITKAKCEELTKEITAMLKQEQEG
jgi:hypothetical protein